MGVPSGGGGSGGSNGSGEVGVGDWGLVMTAEVQA